MSSAPPVQVLYRDDRVAITDYRCVAKKGEAGGDEFVVSYEIVFVRGGLFRVTVDGDSFVATRNEMLLLAPGDVYRIDHPVAGGDVCTVISLAPSLLHELQLDAKNRDNPFKRHRALSDPLSYAKHLSLLRALRNGADSLQVEEIVSEIATRLTSLCPDVRSGTRAIERVQELLAVNSSRKLTLSSLARIAGLSPFHLSRSFKAATGLSIHRYLIRLRLRDALHRLEGGEADITRLALDVGYSNHAHFTTAFGQEFGMSPSAYRSLARRAAALS